MSIDFQLRQSCPHFAIQSPASLDINSKTILLPFPIGAFGLVRVYVNKVEVPSAGLFRLDPLYSYGGGPYAIPPQDASITVMTDSGRQIIALPFGRSVSQTDIVRALQQYPNFIQASGGPWISLSPVEVTDSFISVSGPAADLIGFKQKASRTREIHPGWKLFGGIQGKYIEFTSPLHGNTNLQVSYPFEPSTCPRCKSTRIENDFAYDVNGLAITVANEDLLIQGVLKSILTDLGSNPYHPWYGSKIRSRIGLKAIGSAASLVKEDIALALANFQDLQTKQARYQTITPEERLSSIVSLTVNSINGSPSAFQVDMVLKNASSRQVRFSTVFTVPGVVQLT